MINNMGVDPDEWFEMPPRPEEEVAEYITDEYAPCDVEYPDESDEIEASKKKEPDDIHEVMFQMATKNGGSWLGGSENLGGSEVIQK